MQYEEAKTELSELKEKYEKAEQEKQSLTDELEECKANMKDLQEKGTKVSAAISYTEQILNKITYNCLTNNVVRGAWSVEIMIKKKKLAP